MVAVMSRWARRGRVRGSAEDKPFEFHHFPLDLVQPWDVVHHTVVPRSRENGKPEKKRCPRTTKKVWSAETSSARG